MQTTANLSLPFIAAAQAQKHVTHNEALAALDALVHLAVASRTASAPPAAVEEGARYLVAAPASGGWAGREGQIAVMSGGAWSFLAPRAGWRVWLVDEARLIVWSGVLWRDAFSLNPTPSLGVNTVADAANRLAVKANAALFCHDDVTPGSGDMRLVVNKAQAARTGSLTFQTGYSGRAEIGAVGDDDLSVKVSANGSAWTLAARFVASSGEAIFRQVAIDNAAGTSRHVEMRTAGSPRWRFGASFDPETGANAGSKLFINAFSDSGAFLGTPLLISRDNLTVQFPWISFPMTGPVFHKEVLPSADNTLSVGASARRWSVVYAATGVINTSDARQKTDIVDCPLGLDFIRALSPRAYRWKDGGGQSDMECDALVVEETVDGRTRRVDREGPPRASEPRRRPGRRLHVGLIAQDVKAALDAAGVDCGLWVLDDPADPSSPQSLRYDQFVAPLVQAVKELSVRVVALEAAARAAH